MVETITILTSMAVLLLVGFISSMIASKLKIPDILLLILVGMAIGRIQYHGMPLIEFPSTFLTSISLLALVMIVFHSSSKFKLKQMDTFSFKAIRLTLFVLALNMIFLTFTVYFIYNIPMILCLVFSALVSGTDPSSTLSIIKTRKNKVMEFLSIESLVNTPLVVLLPFVILNMWGIDFNLLFTRSIEQISPFIQQIVTGVGAGVVLGIISFEIMRKKYSAKYSPIAIVVIALLTYVLAEELGGNGVLAVVVLGLIFGNFHLKERAEIKIFETVFTDFLQIFVFLLVGLMIKIPLTADFLISSMYIFLILMLIRWLAVMLFSAKEKYTLREKIFMALHAPRGIAVSVVVFSLILYPYSGMKVVLDLSLAILLYSIVLAAALTFFKKFFLGKEVV